MYQPAHTTQEDGPEDLLCAANARLAGIEPDDADDDTDLRRWLEGRGGAALLPDHAPDQKSRAQGGKRSRAGA